MLLAYISLSMSLDITEFLKLLKRTRYEYDLDCKRKDNLSGLYQTQEPAYPKEEIFVLWH